MEYNFNDESKKVINLMQVIAFEMDHNLIGSEHLLLALIKNDNNILSDYLKKKHLKYSSFYDKIKTNKQKGNVEEYSLELKEIFDDIYFINKKEYISLNDIILSLLNNQNNAVNILKSFKVDVFYLINQLSMKSIKKSDLSSLNDLHLMGEKENLLIGREQELNQLISSLCRRNKPNAILIGNPGVGKTSIVEALAKKLLANQIEPLKGKVIYELDIASCLGGTKYRGEFEEKMKKIIKKIIEDQNAIIFIDEIHNVVKAGGAEGAIDASNILKPYLSRGDIQIIGATTKEEFAHSFEADPALKRRFQLIEISSSNEIETLDILRKTKHLYEDFHHLIIPDDVLNHIVDVSNKYLTNTQFPDKAIELLDNACVRANNTLSRDNINDTLKKLYGIRLDYQQYLNDFSSAFDQQVYGQNNIKDDLINYLNHKAKYLIFCGETGTGKSLVSSLIGHHLYHKYLNLNVFSFNDYYGIQRLTSFYPQEYISPLIKFVKENKQGLIIFDHMEIASKDLFNFVIQMMENKYILDHKANMIPINNYLFIFSFSSSQETLNFHQANHSQEWYLKQINNKFISLVDGIIYFSPHNMDSLNKIIHQHIDHCSNEERNGISYEINHISLTSNLNLYQTLCEIKIKN